MVPPMQMAAAHAMRPHVGWLVRLTKISAVFDMYLGDYGNRMGEAVSKPVAHRFSCKFAAGNCGSLRCADQPSCRRRGLASNIVKRVDGYIRQRIFDMFDSAGELAMNDAMIAAEVREEESREAHDFVEMGNVSDETKGGLGGTLYDGALGRWNA